MKEIKLSKGMVALVDDDDYDFLNQWKWYALKATNTWYAYRNIKRGNKRTIIAMHRLILNVPKGFQSDHQDGNGLNNQRGNLRICTVSENQHNQHRVWGVSKLRGVYWHIGVKKWRSRIKLNGKERHVGYFITEAEAGIAYEKAKRDYLYGAGSLS